MRIVLYNPRSNSAGKRIMPFSLLALGAVLEGEFEYEILDGNAAGDPGLALQGRLSSGATVFGMSVMPGPQLEDAFQRTRALKAASPNAIVIWGGYFPTEHPEACLSGGWVDYAIRGHGEFATLSLLREVAAGRDPRRSGGIDGVAFLRSDGTLAQGAGDDAEEPGLAPGRHNPAGYEDLRLDIRNLSYKFDVSPRARHFPTRRDHDSHQENRSPSAARSYRWRTPHLAGPVGPRPVHGQGRS